MGMIRDPERESIGVAVASTRWLVIRTKPGKQAGKREMGTGFAERGWGKVVFEF